MAKPASAEPKEVSPAVFIGIIAVVVLVVGVIAWKVFSPPADPRAGMTDQQKLESMKKAAQNYQPPPPPMFKSGMHH